MSTSMQTSASSLERRSFTVLALAALGVALFASDVRAADPEPEPAAIALLNDFMAALRIDDYDASAKAVMPLVHVSLLSKDRTDLSPDLRRFGHKKAHDNAKFYASPVKITRIRETGVSAIGFRDTAEKGRVVDYFIAKKDGVGGMPAPIKVFFPEGGKPPRISYMGSI